MADAKQGGSAVEGSRTEIARGEAGGLVQQAQVVISQVQQKVAAIPPQRRTWMFGSLLFLAAGFAGLMWYWQRPDWQTLYTGLEAKDVQTVSQELAAAAIPFNVTADGGGIQVPADMMDKARMEVATKGMPTSGRMGFEIFDKPNWVGSEFDEHVNYERALSGELERSIATLGVVRSARVNLVLPQQSLFSGQEKVAKASVVLKLRKGSLGQEQIDVIRSVVAASVEGLSADNVTLADADGRVDMSPKRRGGGTEGDLEQTLEAKLISMLEPVAGRENVHATVTVSYDDSTKVVTEHEVDPGSLVKTSEHTSEQSNGNKAGASGVPGTASNTAGAAVSGSVAAAGAAVAAGTPPLLKEPLPVYPTASGPGSTMKEQTNATDYNHTDTQTQMGPGRVRRVTAAIVVNDKQSSEGAGKTEHMVWKRRSAEDMKQLEQLAQAAVGFDTTRGDQVVIANASFNSNAPEVKLAGTEKALDEAKTFVQTQPGLLRTGMMGVVAILAVMFVFRPVAKQLISTLSAPVLLGAGTPTGSARTVGGGGVSAAALGDGNFGTESAMGSMQHEEEQMAAPKRRQMKQGQVMFEHVADSIVREPVQSTRLLETWIGPQEAD